ncbi:GTPase ObgE [Fodinisporobacter ferrooxydans]|uniref:GTPase Obg n=1 Tax=Fodinisporobacter ferrooxydans TaxID=2901836 RepID=A0ABY4CI05_9BACL|nr:GTPase ObgE [Alicyclobacillaceae bacterium MYW30-H2]
MFVDTARVYVKGGDGGNGMVAYRREKYVPEGGPAGGDGGHGGDVIFAVDEGLRTLLDFKYQRHYKASPGENGRNKNQHGRSAESYIVKVPPGTVVTDADTGEFLGDLTANGQQLIVAKGGRGGRGNTRFATAKNKAPDMAEKGEPGEERWVQLELKVIADVGLVGFPSVGKSTLLSVVSAARPKIGAYHFTTLSPNLGVVDVGDGRSFVLADLPGLIEGAHEGQGLGMQFLRHVERTRVILHVVDMAGSEGRDPYEDWLKINEELQYYNAKLEQRPQVIVANKMDISEAEERLQEFRQKVGDGFPIYPVSGMTRQGIQELLYKVADILDSIPAMEPDALESVEEITERKVYKVEEEAIPFTIHQENGAFIVESARLEKLVRMTNFEQYDAVKRFQRIMKGIGVDQALREKGAQDGDMVIVGDLEFEYSE